MGVWKLVRLKFGRCPVHFGSLGIGLEQTSERIQSDTLFSAWISAYARLSDDSRTIEELLQQFNTPNPPFRLSSTFIYQRLHGEIVDYLPRPLTHPPGFTNEDQVTLGKKFKTLNYLPQTVWRRWYQTEGFKDPDRRELQSGAFAQSNTGQRKQLCATLQIGLPDGTDTQFTEPLANLGTFCYSEAFQTQRVPKVAIDRITRATNFYHAGFVHYQWQPNPNELDDIESLSGLYFLVYFPQENPELQNTFFAVLDFLGGEGVGGERSSGAGQFKPTVEELSPAWQAIVDYSTGNAYCLTSLFWQHPLPQNLSESLHHSSYNLQERGGWITSPVSDGRQLRRQAVQMFTEGSVFPVLPEGRLADVTPLQKDRQPKFQDHKIYRSGISLSLSMNRPEE